MSIIDLYEKLTDHTRRAADCASGLDYYANQEDIGNTLESIKQTMTQLSEAAAVAVEISIRKGNSQNQTAIWLGVPASTLRGAKKEFST